MKKLSKILCLAILAVVVAFTAIACDNGGGNTTDDGNKPQGTTTYDIKYMIGDTLAYSTTADKGETLKAYKPNDVEGSVFDAWYLDADLTKKLSDKMVVNKNLTLYAKFIPKTFTVRFVDYDGTELAVIENVPYGTAVTAPDVTSLGSKFTGWDTSFSSVKSNLTVTATYTSDIRLTFLDTSNQTLFTVDVPIGTKVTDEIFTQALDEATQFVSDELTAEFLLDDDAFTPSVAIVGDTLPACDITFTPSLKLNAPTGLTALFNGNTALSVFNGTYPLSGENSYTFGFKDPGTGKKATYTASCTVNDEAVTLSNGKLDFAGFTPGKYTAKYTVTASYKNLTPASATVSVSITIAKGTIPEGLLGASDVTCTYDNAAHSISVNAASDSNYTVLYSETANGDFTATNPAYTDAGIYDVYYIVTREHYESSDVNNVQISINKKDVTITANKPNDISYGDPKPTFSYTTDVENFSGISIGYDCNYIAGNVPGTYTVTPKLLNGETQGKAKNYNFKAYVSAQFTVAKRAITVTVTGSKDYDGDVWEGNYTVTGLAPQYTAQGSATTKSVVNGTYTAEADFEVKDALAIFDRANSNVTQHHTATYVYNVSINIGSFPLSASGKEVTYDANDHAIDPVTSTIKGATVSYSLTNGSGYTADIPTVKDAGEYTVYYKVVDANGVLADQNGSVVLKINRATATVTANNATVIYGEDAPEYTVTCELLGADTIDSVTFTCDYAPGTAVGNYTITPVATDINYTFTPVPAILTVTRRDATIKANDATATYGDATPEFSATYTLFGSDTVEVTYTCSYAKGNDAGTYDIMPSASNSNYNITCEKGTLTVGRKSATITANNASVTYGSNAPAYGHTTSGLETGDSVTVEYVCAYSKGTDVGTYDITPSATHKNYDFNCVDGTLTVSKKALTVNISGTKYDDGTPWSKEFTDITGLLLNERAQGAVKTTASSAASYTTADSFSWTTALKIIRDGSVDSTGNYNISYRYNVTINVCPFIIHAVNYTGTYSGSAQSPAEITLEDRDTKADITKDAVITYRANAVDDYGTDVPSYTNAGEYTVYYNIAYSSQNFTGEYTVTINKKYVTVTPNAKSISYGDAVPALTAADATIIGLNEGTNVTVYISCPTYAQGSIVGSYDIVADAGGADADNYTFKFYTGTLTVTKRAVTITADDKNVTYGDAVPTYTATYTLYGNDTVEVTYDCDYVQGSDVNTYAITPSASAGNYDFTCVDGTVTVAKKHVTATVNNKTIKYGDVAPDFGLSYTLYSDDVVAISVNCNYTQGSNAGTYTVSLSADTTASKYGNYDFALGEATLTVSKRTLRVVISDVNIEYGDNFTIPYTTTADGFDGLYGTDLFAPALSTTATVPTVGTYDITYTANSNYTLTANTAKLTVAKRAVSIVWTGDNDSHVYTGSDLKGSVTAKYLAYTGDYLDATTITFNGANAFLHAGTYALAATVTDANYEVSNTTSSATIQKGKVTITPNQIQSITYTGSEVSFAKSSAEVKFNGSDVNTDGIVFGGTYKATAAGTYALTISYSTNDLESDATQTAYLKVQSVQIGNNWYTIEDALATATNGQTIYVRYSTTFADATIKAALYADSQYRTVKTGVTLCLPSAEDTNGVGNPVYNTANVNRYVDTDANLIQEKLTIPSHITLDVNGTILINGVLGSSGVQRNGHTSGKHGQIINDGTINLASASTLDVRGFVKGSGTLNANNGSKIYSPFVTIDYRGGTNTVTVYQKGDIAPFNQWEMPNLQCKTVFNYGVTHIGYLDLYASKQHNTSQVKIYGTSNDCFFIMSSGSSVTKTYSSGVSTIRILGNVTMGTLKITVTLLGEQTVSMSDVQFPLPWTYKVIVGDGTTQTTLTNNYDLKLMTGTSITIEKNATVNLGGKAIIYESFTNTMSSKWSSGTNGYVYPAGKAAANVTVKGTLNVTGGIAGKLHGVDGGKVIIASGATLSLTSSEGDSGDTSSTSAMVNLGTYYETTKISETAKLVAGSTVTAAEAGKTYTYNGSAWTAA